MRAEPTLRGKSRRAHVISGPACSARAVVDIDDALGWRQSWHVEREVKPNDEASSRRRARAGEHLRAIEQAAREEASWDGGRRSRRHAIRSARMEKHGMRRPSSYTTTGAGRTSSDPRSGARRCRPTTTPVACCAESRVNGDREDRIVCGDATALVERGTLAVAISCRLRHDADLVGARVGEQAGTDERYFFRRGAGGVQPDDSSLAFRSLTDARCRVFARAAGPQRGLAAERGSRESRASRRCSDMDPLPAPPARLRASSLVRSVAARPDRPHEFELLGIFADQRDGDKSAISS